LFFKTISLSNKTELSSTVKQTKLIVKQNQHSYETRTNLSNNDAGKEKEVNDQSRARM